MLRSILAVVAGIVTLTIVSFAIEWLVEPFLLRTLSNQLWVMLAGYTYTLPCIALGGWVTALVAQRTPVKHALIMGGIQAALVIPAMLANPGLSPTWNWLLGMALIVPAAWAGGMLRARQTQPRVA